mmetsp:Transcript_24238/g.54673  ORF Transcript_24238/g.54673 Transcript_24238/m.54673 type:complete len:167 (-) Transcript_24238:275-775(-)
MNAIIKAEGLNVTEDAKDALLSLSGGDMRRVLNVMQASHMAASSAPGQGQGGGASLIDARAVYLCTGDPLPEDISRMLHLMLNESFESAFVEIRSTCYTNGYALSDVIRELTVLVLGMGLPEAVLGQLLDELSTIEWRLAAGCSDKVQLASLVGSFMVAREAMTPE